jgi:hypothetical protein
MHRRLEKTFRGDWRVEFLPIATFFSHVIHDPVYSFLEKQQVVSMLCLGLNSPKKK